MKMMIVAQITQWRRRSLGKFQDQFLKLEFRLLVEATKTKFFSTEDGKTSKEGIMKEELKDSLSDEILKASGFDKNQSVLEFYDKQSAAIDLCLKTSIETLNTIATYLLLESNEGAHENKYTKENGQDRLKQISAALVALQSKVAAAEYFIKRSSANRKQSKEFVILDKPTYQYLMDETYFLTALEASGVDNWEWYGDAYDEFHKMEHEVNEICAGKKILPYDLIRLEDLK